MTTEQEQAPLRPPNVGEAGILQFWLESTKRAVDQLETLGSPYAEPLDDFGQLVYGILNPNEAE